jgi:hypothetical protein
VWTIHLSDGAAISIRLKADSQPCDVALEKLKSMANVPIREFSVSGRPVWEEKEHPRGNTILLERLRMWRWPVLHAHFRVASHQVSASTRTGNIGFFTSRQMTVRQVGDKSRYQLISRESKEFSFLLTCIIPRCRVMPRVPSQRTGTTPLHGGPARSQRLTPAPHEYERPLRLLLAPTS